MSQYSLYKETIWWKEIIVTIGTMSVLFGVLAFFFLFRSTDPESERVLLFIIFSIISVLFIFLTYYFRKLDIDIHNDGVSIGWAYFKKEYVWSDIEEVWKDDRNAMRYGGYGIKGTYMNGKWVLVYNVIMADRVVLKLKEGKYGEFVFSTKDPDKVIGLIEPYLGKQ